MQMEIGGIIRSHLRQTRPSCAVLVNPGIVPSPNNQGNYLIPDLAVTCSPPNPGRLYMLEPVLIVEILSPSNQKEIWLNVSTYTTIPSLGEILVIDSSRVNAELWRRNDNNSWLRKQSIAGSEILELSSIDFSFELTEAYQGTGLV
jgi:Uma2 family endonuclease